MSTPLVIKCGHLADEMSTLPSLPCPRVTPEHPARPPPSASQAARDHPGLQACSSEAPS